MNWKNKSQWPALIVLCTVAVYIIARVWKVDITNDEAYSFHNMKRFWYAEALCTGNTHWLNSLAIKCAITLNCEKVWQIRWLSLLSAMVFCAVVFLWARTFKQSTTVFFICALLLLNPYIIDYLSLARGYAPGLMLEALALLLFFKATAKQTGYISFIALLCAGLSALANFSFAYFFAAFCLVHFYNFHFRKGFAFLRSVNFYRDFLFALAIIALVARAIVFISRCSNDVTGAGTEFFEEYFMVLPNGLIYGKTAIGHLALKILSYLAFGLILIGALFGVFARKKHRSAIYFHCSAMLLGIVIISLAGRFLFGIVLPWYRSCIFLFPLTCVCLVYFLDGFISNSFLKRVTMLLSGLALAINFVFSMNTSSALECKETRDLKQSLDMLATRGAKRVGLSPALFGCFTNYYRMTADRKYLFLGERLDDGSKFKNPGGLEEYDHFILTPPYKLNYSRKQATALKAVRFFRETGTLVLEVKK